MRASHRTVGRQCLRSKYVRLYPDTWVRNDLTIDATVRAQAAWAWCSGRGVLSGYSAAAIHGTLYLPTDANAEVTVTDRRRHPLGITVSRKHIPDTDRCSVRGYVSTTPARTAFDLCRDLAADAAVEAVDALYQATGLNRDVMAAYLGQCTGRRGWKKVHALIALTDEGAQSIWETRSRMFVIRGGLPRPESQVNIYDRHGEWIGRFDLVYREAKVVIEYDGDHHFEREQRHKDVRRWNALVIAGWTVIRIKARQLLHEPELLLAQIRSALIAGGLSL